MINQFKIQEATYLHSEDTINVSTFKRFLVFNLDYLLFYIINFITFKLFESIVDKTIIEDISIMIIIFFIIIFTSIEYYFNGTIFKIIFGMRSINSNGGKLSYYLYILKFFLRFIAVFTAIIRIWTMLIPIVFIINLFRNLKYYKIIPDFFSGQMIGLWYDRFINQKVIYINKS